MQPNNHVEKQINWGFMKIKYFIILFILFALPVTQACAKKSAVVNEKTEGKGKTVVYPVTKDQAWEISKAVLRWSGAKTEKNNITEYKNEGYMLASAGMNAISWGTIMGVWIESVDKKNTRVTVITKRKFVLSMGTRLTENGFHKKFEEAMQIVKSGQPLPFDKPKKK